MIYGWSAVLPKLEEDTSKFVVTKDDVSWLGDYAIIFKLINASVIKALNIVKIGNGTDI